MGVVPHAAQANHNNGADHQEALRAALMAASVSKPGERLRLDEGEALVRGVFTSVTRHDFTAPLFPPPEAVAAYVRSVPRCLHDGVDALDRAVYALTRNYRLKAGNGIKETTEWIAGDRNRALKFMTT